MADSQPANPKSTATVFLDEPPCCLEFVPTLPRHCIVGTYQLERQQEQEGEAAEIAQGDSVGAVGDGGDESKKEPELQTRYGRLYLLHVVDDAIHQVQSVPVSAAVLDVRFCPYQQQQQQQHQQQRQKQQSSHVFAVATSLGFIGFYAVDVQPGGGAASAPQIRHLGNVQVLPREELVTSLVWLPEMVADTLEEDGDEKRTEVSGRRLAFTSTSGAVCMMTVHVEHFETAGRREHMRTTVDHQHVETADSSSPGTGEMQVVHQHAAEAWIVGHWRAGPQSHDCVILSGGDDACLTSSWLGADGKILSERHWSNRRMHGSGVTAIVSLTGRFIVTGSYDDSLRVIELPTLTGTTRPVIHHELHLGGGVWRVQVFAVRDGPDGFLATLLVSCMYAGAFVVSLEADAGRQTWTSRVLAHFGEHESMVYAGRVVEAEGVDKRGRARAFVTCSFYDRRVCLWSIV